jgi:signal peptidase I
VNTPPPPAEPHESAEPPDGGGPDDVFELPPPPPAEAAEDEGSGDEAPHGTEAFLGALLALLDDGPLTADGIARACDARWPAFLEGRRGFIHAALLQLRRRGVVQTSWTPGPHARRLFALRGDERLVALEDSGAEDAPTAVHDAVAKMVRSLGFAPRIQADLARDLTDHLIDSARATGGTGDESVRAALRDFGDPWRIRTDLRRTAQGRRTVLFPRGIGETLAGLAIYDAGILLAIVGVIVFVRLQMLTAYHIPTRSMEPTLHGDRRDGDRILVNRLSGPPDRFEVYVFDGWGAERKNYVKRCVGLPNERLRLREGDVYIDDVLYRKDGDIYESLLFRLYHWDDVWTRAAADNPDDNEEAHEQVFDEQMQLWENITGRWELHTRHGYQAGAPAEGEDAVLRWQDSIHDDLYEPDTGDYEGGVYSCPDVRITADVTLGAPGASLTLRLTRGAATYDAVVSEGAVSVTTDGDEVLSAAVPAVRVDEPLRVLFSQVDRVLRLEIDGQVLRHDLPQPEFPKRTAPSGIVEFRVRGGPVNVKPICLERDVFYTPDYDTDDEVELGPYDYYMLGDNSGNSQDSRRNGPVHRRRLVGKPILIVWPPARWRDPATSPFGSPR